MKQVIIYRPNGDITLTANVDDSVAESYAQRATPAGHHSIIVDPVVTDINLQKVDHATKRVVARAEPLIPAYITNRRKEYPHIVDQLDALWDAMDKGELPKAKTFYKMIKDVKDKYPKP